MLSKINVLEWVGYGLAVVLGWLVSFAMPVKNFLGLTLALVVCDFITGVWAAKHRGETIQSKGFRRTVKKTVLYFIAILLAKGVEDVLGIPTITYVVASFIALTEFKSNLENIQSYTGTDIWSRIIERIPDLFKNLKK